MSYTKKKLKWIFVRSEVQTNYLRTHYTIKLTHYTMSATCVSDKTQFYVLDTPSKHAITIHMKPSTFTTIQKRIYKSKSPYKFIHEGVEYPHKNGRKIVTLNPLSLNANTQLQCTLPGSSADSMTHFLKFMTVHIENPDLY